MTAEPSNNPKFSEYLAALDQTAADRNEFIVRDEEPSAAEISSGWTEDEEEYEEAVVEAAVSENLLQAAKNGVAAGVKAGDADGGAADEVLADDAVPYPRLAEAAPETDGKDAAGGGISVEKNAAVDESNETLPAGRRVNAESTAKEESGVKLPESGAFDAGTTDTDGGLRVDEKMSELGERLAGGIHIGEEGENVAAGKKNAGKNVAASNVASNAASLDGANAGAVAALGAADAVSRAAALHSKEKNGGAPADGEKKSPSERVRKHTASERLDAAGLGGADVTRVSDAAEPRRVSAAPEAEITVNLRGESRSASGERSAFNGMDGAKPAASFETFLTRELQQNLNSDIVRQAQVLLREGGEGTIRLSLKPESLGKVKIHLEMTENKITGKIVVESGEALRAFEHEMESLEQTFRGEGFDGASLSLELAEHDEPRGSEGEWRTGGERISTKTASSRYDDTAGKSAYFGAAYSAKQINVLV
jgi:flagellar hook-length control protein FliK